ncbi:MAG: twin-arginine translocase subunit TatC [Acholeplasmataceae bacterium]|nr:twin-arginine translocase subunit TatC [Acholeplasmataceae bacterium]
MRENPTLRKEIDSFDEIEVYKQPIGEHIKVLRRSILHCIITIALAFFIIITFYSDALMQILLEPIKSRGIQFIYLGLAEAMVAQLQVSFIAACIVSSPLIFWEVWSFIRPALYENERKAVLFVTLISLALFITGVCFGYLAVFLSSITFFVYMGENLATPMLSISEYVGFLMGFILPFGIVFEIPIATFVLCRVGLLKVETLVHLRKYIILVIFIVAAFLTPPDILSQILMALPMIGLYEVGIIVAKYARK